MLTPDPTKWQLWIADESGEFITPENRVLDSQFDTKAEAEDEEEEYLASGYDAEVIPPTTIAPQGRLW